MLRHAMFTGLVLAILLLTGAIAAVATGASMVRRRRALPGGTVRALPSGTGDELATRTIRELRAGDVITFEARDYLVEGVVDYEEDGHRWSAGRLVDGSDEHWLVVGLERGGSLVARMLREDPEVEMSGYPPDVLAAGGVRYMHERRGTATAHMSGATGLGRLGEPAARSAGQGTAAVERCRWWLYEAPGDDTLLVEQWSDVYRVVRGKKISLSLLELMPGS